MKMSGTSRRPHVVMSQRRDVGSTSGIVATSQRRDVSTSRRCNVVTLRVLFSHHLKENRVQKLRYRETYGLGHGI